LSEKDLASPVLQSESAEIRGVVILAIIPNAFLRCGINQRESWTMKDGSPFRTRCLAIKHRIEYFSIDYADLIRANGILISVSHRGNSWGLQVVLT
jgi:hypothetical protein